jgi:PAS domain S-box-containing protein
MFTGLGGGHETASGLRATIDLAPIGLAQFEPTGRLLYVNERLCEILGCARQDLLARTFQEITFSDDLPHCLALTEQVVSGAAAKYSVQKRFVRGDGSLVWTRITVSAVRDAAGAVEFLIGAAEDISEQVSATEALRASQERLRAALDASMTGTFRWDVTRNALDWADGLERVFGPGERQSLDDFFASIHPEDLAPVMRAYRDSAATGADFEEEFRVRWADGSIHWLHDRGRTVLDAHGAPAYIVGAITDISSHKRMEETILLREAQSREALQREQEARRAAERATAARQQVLGFVAHDLRNPLQVILTAASVLALPLTPEQRTRPADVLRRSALEMERLITDLLDVSRIEAGTFSVRREVVALDDVLHDAIEAWLEPARAKGVALESVIARDLPPISGDRQRLKQAVGNLLGNAVKFTPAAGRVRLEASRAGAQVVVTVEDTGCGIPPEDHASIFDRFWQRDRALGGAGLGLAIVKGIVASHQGEIGIDSAPGRGTTFRVRLPAPDAITSWSQSA